MKIYPGCGEEYEKRHGGEITQKWWDYMADIMETNSDNSPVYTPIDEVSHPDQIITKADGKKEGKSVQHKLVGV